MGLIELIGFIPAIVFPVATLAQLHYLVKNKTADGVSILAWSAFSLGNASLYIYTEKYNELQSIIGLLVTAVLQLLIVGLVLKYRHQQKVTSKTIID